MTTYQFSDLWNPLKINDSIAPNRIIMSPMTTNYADDRGFPTPEMIQHYADRAAGGTGTIIIAATMIEGTYQYLPHSPSLKEDAAIPAWKDLADAVHSGGALLLAQLFHPGYSSLRPDEETLRRGWTSLSPSGLVPPFVTLPSRAMSIEEIGDYIGFFTDAALRAKAAGLDGVEVHAAHAHGLLGAFLSPIFNKRQDEYGGTTDRRVRFLLEVIRSIRKACGRRFIIDVRLSGSDNIDGGLSLFESSYIAALVEDAGADMLHISGGTTISRGSFIPAPGEPPVKHAPLAAEIRRHVHIPVAVVGGITQPWIAEQVLKNGWADACVMGRQLLCEPEWVKKASSGRVDEIRPCIGCFECIMGIKNGGRLVCAMNPEVDPHARVPAPTVPASPRRILVIGGGPAGLEAAYRSAAAGNETILCEASRKLGGNMFTASIPLGKDQIAGALSFLISRARSAGVEIRTNCRVTLPEIVEMAPDEIILATGSDPFVPGAVREQIHADIPVVSAREVLEGPFIPGRRIVILGGGMVGCETADFLAEPYDENSELREITVLEMRDKLAAEELSPAREVLFRRMKKKNIKTLMNARVIGVEGNRVLYELDDRPCSIEADTVVLSMGYRHTPSLDQELAGCGIPVRSACDYKMPGKVIDAIRAGYTAACRPEET